MGQNSRLTCLSAILGVAMVVVVTGEKHTLTEREQRDQVSYEALEMLASSQFVRTVGNAWLSKIPRVEDELISLYMTNLWAKEGCRWTQAERLGWSRKLRKIKRSVEKSPNTTDDALGLSKLFKRGVTRHGAQTESVVVNLETITSSLYRSSWMDLVVLKFAGFLRERMVKKQFQHPLCTWTGADRRDASISIRQIVEKYVGQMNTEIFDIFQILPTSHLKGADRFDDPWNQELMATLFDPFYEDDDKE